MKKLLETKLYTRNLIKGINTWTVPLVRHLGPFLKRMREGRKQVGQRTRKLVTMCKALRPRDDIDGLYVSRKEEGRRLTSILDNVDTSIQWLKDYVKKCGGRLITATRNNTDNTRINRTKISRKQKWEAKQLYGYFKWQTSKISHEKTWTGVKKRNPNSSTE